MQGFLPAKKREGASKCRFCFRPRREREPVNAGFPFSQEEEGMQAFLLDRREREFLDEGLRSEKRRNKKAGVPANIREGAKWIHRNLQQCTL